MKRTLIFILLGLIILAGGALFALRAFPKPGVTQTPPTVNQPATVPETSFTLTADTPSLKVGDTFKVSVLARSDSDAANLFVAKLRFPADLLQATNIDLKPKTGNSFISSWFVTNWVENVFDNKLGSVSLVGGVPNPGFKTEPQASPSAMAEITFTAKKGGAGSITFDNTSAIYRNSDNTNILNIKREVSFKIIDASQSAAPISTIRGDINGDGKVDLSDLSALLSKIGQSTISAGTVADLNSDSLINSFDYSSLVNILTMGNVVSSSSSASLATSSANLEMITPPAASSSSQLNF
ncbi:MAG: dockerin type I domain-containing protein [Patescibacteria group bacterium]|nr:dockerin type I domain-containing protein [Patescibacteria group bacterium]